MLGLQVYSNLEGNRSHVVNTGWALLALIDAGQVYTENFNNFSDSQNSTSDACLVIAPQKLLIFLIDILEFNIDISGEAC